MKNHISGQTYIDNLAAALGSQLSGIAQASSALAASFQAVTKGNIIKHKQEQAAVFFGVQADKNERPVETLTKIADAADAQGLNTAELKEHLATIGSIADIVEAEKTSFVRTVKLAQSHLKTMPKYKG
jgi:uncharacterized protein YjcR